MVKASSNIMLDPEVILSKNEQTTQANEIVEFRGEVLEDFAGNLEHLFLKRKHEQD